MLLIDPPAWPAHGRLWSHLVSTTSYAELHDFAARAGIPRRAFEGDHYDVPEERYADVVAAGAVATDGRDLLRRLRDSGLRIAKRKHERVVQSTPEAPWLPPGSRADVIASRQDDAPPQTVVVRLAVRGDRGLLVVERADGRGPDLPTRTVGEGQTPEECLRELAASVGVDLRGTSGALVSGETGSGTGRAALLGYVRNVVPHPDADYPWPTPNACFAVFGAASAEDRLDGARWLAPEAQEAALGERHWWPLLAPDDHSASGHGHG